MYVKMISDIWFIFDMMINFRTGIVMNTDTDISLNVKRIRTHYLKVSIKNEFLIEILNFYVSFIYKHLIYKICIIICTLFLMNVKFWGSHTTKLDKR